MTDATRRGFLAAAGAGAVTVAAVAASPGAAAAPTAGPVTGSATTDTNGGDQLGEREVVVRDRDLVARLSKIARG